MSEELQTRWQNLTPEVQAALQFGGVILAALVLGHVLGGIVARALRNRNFDAVLRLPGSTHDPDPDRGFTPSYVAGLLVRLTVWTAAAWWLAKQNGRIELAATLALVINRTWALATVLTAALTLGSLLANRLMACLGGGAKGGSPGLAYRNGAAGAAEPRKGPDAAGVVGAGAYVLVLLLVLLIAADVFDWPLTRSSAQALWQFAQHLLVACAALFIGYLGANWARELATPEGASSPEKRASQYTALGIVASSTVLAVAVLLSSAGVLYGIAAIGILGLFVWLVRGQLPDVIAGLQLRAHKVSEVQLDGEPWQVAEIGFVSTQVGRRGEFLRLPNRQVLEARLHGATAEAVVR